MNSVEESNENNLLNPKTEECHEEEEIIIEIFDYKKFKALSNKQTIRSQNDLKAESNTHSENQTQLRNFLKTSPKDALLAHLRGNSNPTFQSNQTEPTFLNANGYKELLMKKKNGNSSSSKVNSFLSTQLPSTSDNPKKAIETSKSSEKKIQRPESFYSARMISPPKRPFINSPFNQLTFQSVNNGNSSNSLRGYHKPLTNSYLGLPNKYGMEVNSARPFYYGR